MSTPIAGLVPYSTVDYPGQIAAVAFLQGCPWRCAYCHNPHLQSRKASATALTFEQLIAFLEKRKGLLDALIFSGGEPLLAKELPEWLAIVKGMGFAVGVHTGGAYPERLQQCLPYLDWVGLDIKTSFAEYADITCVPNSGTPVEATLNLLLDAQLTFECRTTFHPSWLAPEKLVQLAQTLNQRGVTNYAVQEARGPMGSAPLASAIQEQLKALFPVFQYR